MVTFRTPQPIMKLHALLAGFLVMAPACRDEVAVEALGVRRIQFLPPHVDVLPPQRPSTMPSSPAAWHDPSGPCRDDPSLVAQEFPQWNGGATLRVSFVGRTSAPCP